MKSYTFEVPVTALTKRFHVEAESLEDAKEKLVILGKEWDDDAARDLEGSIDLQYLKIEMDNYDVNRYLDFENALFIRDLDDPVFSI